MTSRLIGTQVLLETIRESASSMIIPIYLTVMLAIFFGGILFAVEYDQVGGGLPDTMTSWWMLIVTMTTVGYGDFYPVTPAGRVIITFAMFAGLAIIAMPLSIVGNSFQAAWERSLLMVVVEKVRLGLMLNGRQIDDALAAFRTMDVAGDGTVTYADWKYFIKTSLGLPYLSATDVKRTWMLINTDHNSEITYSEFGAALFPHLDFEMLHQLLVEAIDKASDREIAQLTAINASCESEIAVLPSSATGHAKANEMITVAMLAKQVREMMEQQAEISRGLKTALAELQKLGTVNKL
jgi:hypothetical protein